MDFHKLICRFKQFCGMRLVWQYAKLGVDALAPYVFLRIGNTILYVGLLYLPSILFIY